MARLPRVSVRVVAGNGRMIRLLDNARTDLSPLELGWELLALEEEAIRSGLKFVQKVIAKDIGETESTVSEALGAARAIPHCCREWPAAGRRIPESATTTGAA